jgi:predicted DNA-binding transcriptional regulator
MASKDQSIGGLIFVVCVVVALGYTLLLFFPNAFIALLSPSSSVESLRFWLVALPVLLAFVAVLLIGAWIGWTMATTPPPKPIEDFDFDEDILKPTEDEEEEKEEKEEKED